LNSILDPRGQRRTEPGVLAPRKGSLQGATVGLLNSTKRNSDILLAAIGEELVKHYGAREVIERSKPTFSLPVPAALADELVDRCDVIITGVGD
jgi:hypothetical protein